MASAEKGVGGGPKNIPALVCPYGPPGMPKLNRPKAARCALCRERRAEPLYSLGKSGGYFTPDSRLFFAYSSLSAALTENKFIGPGVLAAGAASGFFAWWGFAARAAELDRIIARQTVIVLFMFEILL